MKTLSELIDDAKAQQGFKSDRKLGEHLGFKGSAVSSWRLNKALPADESMIDLCLAGGNDPTPYLVELAKWRAAWNGEAGTWAHWNKISETLSRAVVVLVMAVAGVGYVPVQKVNASTSFIADTYIMRQKRRRQSARFPRLINA